MFQIQKLRFLKILLNAGKQALNDHENIMTFERIILLLRGLTLVQNRFFTAKTLRAQRNDFLFGGKRPPNKKRLLVSEHRLLVAP